MIATRTVYLQPLDVVTSTLDVARENILSGKVVFNQLGQTRHDGVLARAQTQGRGQRGRLWWAEPGESLLATYYFRRGLTDPEHAPQIGLLAGVAVASALRAHLLDIAGRVEESDLYAALRLINRIGLKWPNDLMLGGRKLGGLLIEMVYAPDGDWVALIGVGINIHTHTLPGELEHTATSLAREHVAGADVRELAERIATSLQRVADRRRAEGFEAVLNHWRALDRTYGLRFRATVENQEVEATAVGVDDQGALQLRMKDSRILTVRSASAIREVTG